MRTNENIETMWEEKYKLAEAYFNNFGNLEVPVKFKTLNGIDYNAEGIALGAWIQAQRASYKKGKLSQSKVELLSEIGMRLNISFDSKWLSNYELVQKYYQHYGSLKMSPNFKTTDGINYDASGINLYSWIMRQKFIFNDLPADRQKLFANLELYENTADYENKWLIYYELLKKYKNHYGNVEVNRSFKTSDGITFDASGYNLGNWTYTQRYYYKKGWMQKHRIDLLEELGFRLVTNKRNLNWDAKYKLLKCYYEQYGTIDVPREFRTFDGITHDSDGASLRQWLEAQVDKYEHDLLSKEQENLLRQLGETFIRKVNQESLWNEKFELLRKYTEHYGEASVSFNFTTTDGVTLNEEGTNLYRWLKVQLESHKEGKLSEKRYEMLKSIGVDFIANRREESWHKYYELAKNFFNTYGHLKVPYNFITANGVEYDQNGLNLGLWIRNQKMRYNQLKLSSERIDLLNSIGMIWVSHKNQQAILQLCVDYDIDYMQNKDILRRMSLQDFESKIKFLNANNIAITIDGKLHDIFKMSNANMQINYGVTLEELISKYACEDSPKLIIEQKLQ